jgi:peptidylprolyl isomerase
MTTKAAITAFTALALGVAVAGCGSSQANGVVLAPSGGATSEAATTPVTTTTPTTTTSTAASTPTSGPLSKEPTVTLPSGPAPKTLVKKDLIVGTGATAKSGDQVSVNYVGELYKNGKIFDSSWKDTPGKAYSFQLGVGAVIPGWDQGLVGMKVGGRRELIIPPLLGYKNQAQPAGASGVGIPANSTLVFVVDLLKVSK